MSYSALKKTAKRLSEQASFVVEITSDDEHEQALALMDKLIDDDSTSWPLSLHEPSASKCRAMMVRCISELPS